VVGWADRKFAWQPLAFVIGGIAAGLIINPHLPHNLPLLFEHPKIKLTFNYFRTKVGNEWYPHENSEFIGTPFVACVSMLVVYIAFDPSERRRSLQPLFFLLFSTMLLVLTARWRRIAEYWPPFAVMFAAFSLQPWVTGSRSEIARMPAD